MAIIMSIVTNILLIIITAVITRLFPICIIAEVKYLGTFVCIYKQLVVHEKWAFILRFSKYLILKYYIKLGMYINVYCINTFPGTKVVKKNAFSLFTRD